MLTKTNNVLLCIELLLVTKNKIVIYHNFKTVYYISLKTIQTNVLKIYIIYILEFKRVNPLA